MKVFRYLVALVAGVMAFTACEKDPADLYGVEATAPVMDAHADILLTENTLSETITFSWKEARGMGNDVMYTLYATLDGQEVSLTTTNGTYFTAGKDAFRTQLLNGFGLTANDNFSIGMYVAADNGVTVVKSESITMNVFVYGDYVPAIVSVAEGAEGGVVLTDALTEDIELINWTAARFEYGTNPLYKVEIVYNDGARQELASGMAAQKFSMAPSTLNSTLIALGCPKDAASDVQFIVTSYLEGEGAPQLESTAVTVTVTTYTPSYPEFVQLCGDFGGHAWNTESALPILKGDANTGVYHGVVSIYGQEWGFKVIYTNPKDQSVVWMGGTATSEAEPYTFSISASAGNMMQVADGAGGVEGTFVFYLDLAAAQLTMAPVSSIGLIGSATEKGWDGQTNFEYNPETGAMELKGVTLGEGAYKVRVNDNWGNPWEDPYAYNLGGDPNDMTFGGSDIPSEPGVYDVTMNLSTSANYALTFAKTGDVVIEDPMTKNYGLVGTINNWGETADLVFEAVEGKDYKVVKNVTLKAEDQIKIRVDSDWAENYGGEGDVEPYALAVDTKVTLVAGGKNMSMAAGSYDFYFYPKTKEFIAVAAGENLPTGESIYGLVGVLNGWAAPDVKFTDKGTGEHVLLGQALGASEGFKIRANNEWNDAENYGTLNGGIVAIDSEITLVNGGGSKDMMVEAAGTYDLYFYPADLKLYVMTPGKTPSDAGEPVVPPTPTETVYSVAGDFNGWSDVDMTDNGDGFFVLKNQAIVAGNGFKFKKNHSWADADCWGVDAATTVTIGEAISLIQPGANIPVSVDGTFDIYFNPTTATAYVMNAGEVPGTPAPAAHTYSLVGSFNGWNQTDTTYTMTASATDTYTFSNIALNAYDEFKIVEDYAWTVSYGAAATVVLDQKFTLTSNNGGNIVMPATGTFNITFYAATSELLIEAVGQVTYPTPGGEDISIGLVGDMTGWSATGDILFTKQAGGVYTIESVALTAAQGFKVRKTPTAEKEWDDRYNWGLAASGALTTGVDNDLICGGGAGNIFVAEDGNYKVTFTPATDDKGVIPSQPAKIKVEKIVETPSTPATPLEWGNDVWKAMQEKYGTGETSDAYIDCGNGLQFSKGSGKGVKFGGSDPNCRVQLSGSGNATEKCVFLLTVSGPGTLMVDMQASGYKEGETRKMGVAIDGTDTASDGYFADPDSRTIYTVDCSKAAANSIVSIYSMKSGINIFDIKWTPAQ
ncbi:MAG: SusE domain-containing protein [Alistipes sp.]|nr:SusE domain-containing protein [Alistipes sp.]